MNICPNCGTPVNINDKFCQNCGSPLDQSNFHKTNDDIVEFYQKNGSIRGQINEETISQVNEKIKINNNQSSIAQKAWIIAGIVGILLLTSIFEFVILHPALIFISFFILIMAIIIALMFRGRSKKLESLISGDKLIASWTMSAFEKDLYINHAFKEKKAKNNALLLITAVLMILIFGLFIIFMKDGEERLFMALIGLIVLAIIAIFALGTPYYYRMKNNQKDGQVLIGSKFAYINGLFHNWDYPLSGLDEIKAISKPFKGIRLSYYYTDRTLKHTETIEIPTHEGIDIKALINSVKHGKN